MINKSLQWRQYTTFYSIERYFVDTFGVRHQHHCIFVYATKSRQFSCHLRCAWRLIYIHTRHHHIRHNAKLAQIAQRILRRLSLKLFTCRQPRHIANVYKQAVLASNFRWKFTYCLDKMRTLKVAYRTTNLNNMHICTKMFRIINKSLLHQARHVWHQLHSLATKFAGALIVNQTLIELPRSPDRVTTHFLIQEAFIVSQIKIRLSPIIRHETLTMLARVQKSCIYIKIRVTFLHRNFETLCL